MHYVACLCAVVRMPPVGLHPGKETISSCFLFSDLLPFPPLLAVDLCDRVRENLHVVLAMSPIGESFRNRTRMYPGLVNCTTIDWFQPWPADALVEVATKFIQDIPVGAGKSLVTNDAFLGVDREPKSFQHPHVSCCNKHFSFSPKRSPCVSAVVLASRACVTDVVYHAMGLGRIPARSEYARSTTS